jgi:hypothetical protein
MKKILWLDDFRDPKYFCTLAPLNNQYKIIWVKSYKEFCDNITECGLPDIICFDHDLGEEKTGYDCAKFVVSYCQEHNLDIPKFDIQSSNIVGKENIRSVLFSWHKFFMENMI